MEMQMDVAWQEDYGYGVHMKGKIELVIVAGGRN